MKANSRIRYQVCEIFPIAKGDCVVRIAMLSREIENNGIIHPIYSMGFYALVEELFIHMQVEKLQSLSEFILNLNNNQQGNLLPLESFWLQITHEWMENIIGVCQGQIILTEDQFKDAYCTLFYACVFRAYDDQKLCGRPYKSNDTTVVYYLEDCLPLVSSFIIMKNQIEKTIACTNNQNPSVSQQKKDIPDASLLLGNENFSENLQYLNSIDPNRVSSMASLLCVGLRIYREADGEISVIAKVNQPSLTTSINISLGFIFCGTKDNFRIGYDSTLEQQYLLFSHYQRKINSLKQELNKGISAIQMNLSQQQATLQQNIIQCNEGLLFNQQILEQTKATYQQEQHNLALAEQQNQQETTKCEELKKIKQQLDQDIQKKSMQKNNKEKEYIKTQTQALETNLIIDKKNEELRKRQQEAQEKYIQEKQRADQAKQQGNDEFMMNQSRVINNKFSHGKLANDQDITGTICVNPRKQICAVCAEDKLKKDFIVMDCCGFCACSECIQNTFLSATEDNTLKCLGCQKPLRDLVSFQQQGLLPDQILKQFMKKAFLTCPQCRTDFSVKSNQQGKTKKSDVILTPCCGIEMCRNCQSLKHEKGDICKERIVNCELLIQSQASVVDQMIKDLKEKNPKQLNEEQMENEIIELNKEKRFRFCPDCEVLLIKDAHCEHLKCASCNLEMCFTCAVPRAPSIQHSLSCYHREGCKYYEPEPPKCPRKFCETCPYCVQKGSLCDLPASWEEYKEIVRGWYGDRFFTKEFENNWIQDKPLAAFNENDLLNIKDN